MYIYIYEKIQERAFAAAARLQEGMSTKEYAIEICMYPTREGLMLALIFEY